MNRAIIEKIKIHTKFKLNLINFELFPTTGLLITSFPLRKSTRVGNCLLRDDILILNCLAVSSFRAKSILPNLRFSRPYLAESSEKTEEKSIQGGLHVV